MLRFFGIVISDSSRYGFHLLVVVVIMAVIVVGVVAVVVEIAIGTRNDLSNSEPAIGMNPEDRGIPRLQILEFSD